MRHLNERPTSIVLMMDAYIVDDLKKIGVYLFNALKESRKKPSGLNIPSSAGGLPNRKADRVKWIRTCLADTSFLTFLYEIKLTDIEKAALQEAVHGSGTINWDQFEAKYGDTPRFSLHSHGYGWSKQRKPFVLKGDQLAAIPEGPA